MSITKSYNKQTDTYYAYETTYEWDDARQKKVQRKHCIGKFDPVTGEVVPNGKVGRPSRFSSISKQASQMQQAVGLHPEVDLTTLKARLSKIEELLHTLSDELLLVKKELDRLNP